MYMFVMCFYYVHTLFDVEQRCELGKEYKILLLLGKRLGFLEGTGVGKGPTPILEALSPSTLPPQYTHSYG
jgi:hypothetical protein